MRTCIKAWMSLNLGQIPQLTVELAALERLKNRRHYFRILFILASNEDMHNSLDEFEFRPDPTNREVTSKFEKDRININGDYVMTTIFRRSRAANSVVSGGICPKFKLIYAFMYVLNTCKYEKDPIKNSRESVMNSFFPL